jgi:hypothetical protein
LREIFDSPPDIYDNYRIGASDGGDAVASAALHVIVMDEFDAVARARGGRGGKGEQGDAGVARDSVVNQLLAKVCRLLWLVCDCLRFAVSTHLHIFSDGWCASSSGANISDRTHQQAESNRTRYVTSAGGSSALSDRMSFLNRVFVVRFKLCFVLGGSKSKSKFHRHKRPSSVSAFLGYTPQLCIKLAEFL